MSTTIYDASQITKRRMNKAQSGDFLNRVQNNCPAGQGLAASGDTINAVKTGSMVQYRKNNGGVYLAYNGCPCNSLTSSGSTISFN